MEDSPIAMFLGPAVQLGITFGLVVWGRAVARGRPGVAWKLLPYFPIAGFLVWTVGTLVSVVQLNAAFDALCGLLGWPGRVLRSGFFKHLYGLAGLALIAYTLAHVAQVQGWAALPVSLPWPR